MSINQNRFIWKIIKNSVKNQRTVFTDSKFIINKKDKHKIDAANGWYRFDSRFALPVFDENGEIERYNVFHVFLIVRHDVNGKKYLYDVIKTKKETSNPLSY